MHKFYSIILIMFVTSYALAQQVTRLQHIPELTPGLAARWGKAVMQNDVIGNDFFNDQKIGLSNSNRFHTDWDGWKPVDGFKRTLAGVADLIYEYWEGDNNVDVNIVMKSRNILPDFKQLYLAAEAAGLRYDEDAADKGLEIELDQYLSTGNKLFRTGVNRPRTKERDASADTIFAFGPLVLDINHDHKPEIHPAEQVWWRRKEITKDNFYLFFSCDQSDRYDDKRDFDIVTEDENQFTPWAVRPLKGLFAIPFAIYPGKTKAQFTITAASEENSKDNYTDGKSHFLIYSNDTLAIVKENTGSKDRVKTSFHSICYGFDSPNGSVLGYVFLEMEAGKSRTSSVVDNDQGGYLFLKVTKEITTVTKKVVFNSSTITQ